MLENLSKSIILSRIKNITSYQDFRKLNMGRYIADIDLPELVAYYCLLEIFKVKNEEKYDVYVRVQAYNKSYYAFVNSNGSIDKFIK